MTNAAAVLLDYLRQISLDSVDLRMQRAVLAAQLLSYQAPIHSKATVDEIYDKTIAVVKRVLGEVNEEYTLDIGLALRLYSGMIAARVNLISNPLQFDVIRTVLESDVVESEIGATASEMLVQLASDRAKMMLTASVAGHLDLFEGE